MRGGDWRWAGGGEWLWACVVRGGGHVWCVMEGKNGRK